jgi:hypothetical protein
MAHDKQKSPGAPKRNRARQSKERGDQGPPSFTFKIVPMNQPTAHFTTPSTIHPTTTIAPVPRTASTASCFLENTLPAGLVKPSAGDLRDIFGLKRFKHVLHFVSPKKKPPGGG